MIGDVVAIGLGGSVAAIVLGTLVWLVVTMARTRPPPVARNERYLASSGVDWRHVGLAAFDAVTSRGTPFDIASSDESDSSEGRTVSAAHVERVHGCAEVPADDTLTCESDD